MKRCRLGLVDGRTCQLAKLYSMDLLRVLCVRAFLCVSVLKCSEQNVNHRDTENSQRHRGTKVGPGFSKTFTSLPLLGYNRAALSRFQRASLREIRLGHYEIRSQIGEADLRRRDAW